VQQAAEAARFDELVKTATKIAREGEVRPYVGPGRDYFREKEMLGWSGVRYARKTYSWISGTGRKSKILAHTPFWIGRNCETGAIQCVQGKYSSKGNWHVVTCGSTTGAQVEFGLSDPDSLPVILCEGVSSAWGVLQILGGRALVMATLGKGNLTRCALAARKRFGDSRPIFVMADIDEDGGGQSTAEDATRKSEAVALAPFLSCQSSESRAACLFEECGNWDAWELWQWLKGRASQFRPLTVADFLALGEVGRG
jgi:hypothetical protein